MLLLLQSRSFITHTWVDGMVCCLTVNLYSSSFPYLVCCSSRTIASSSSPGCMLKCSIICMLILLRSGSFIPIVSFHFSLLALRFVCCCSSSRTIGSSSCLVCSSSRNRLLSWFADEDTDAFAYPFIHINHAHIFCVKVLETSA